jgi:DNA-binding IclR family transcriptional regulator
MNDKTGIQVIARAASILRALESEPDGLSLGELAARLGLARSTVQRIVGALSDEQMLISAGPRAGVMLGPALVRLASAANIETDKIVRPVMQDLSRALGETVDLSVLQGRIAMFVDQAVGNQRLVAISAVGEAFPLHCTANGKALLSCLDGDRRQALLPRRLVAHTPRTVTDRAALEEELVEVTANQLAYDLEEHSEGICAVGTAFVDPLGRAFALSVPVPVQRFASREAAIASALLGARENVLHLIPGSRIPK